MNVKDKLAKLKQKIHFKYRYRPTQFYERLGNMSKYFYKYTYTMKEIPFMCLTYTKGFTHEYSIIIYNSYDTKKSF